MPRPCTILTLTIATLILMMTAPAWAQSPTQTQTVHIVATTITEYYTETAPPAPLSTQYTSAEDFRTSMLNETNLYRYQHSASYLYWNTTLAEYAQQYSTLCVWRHSQDNQNGENLARGYTNVTAAVEAWGDERSMYDFDSSHPTGFTEATGHFTQLVWQSTQAVGCGWTDCDGTNGLEGVFLVCEYWPAGNLIGQNDFWFKANVKPEISDDSGFNTFDATKGATGGTPTPTRQSSDATASSAAMAILHGKDLESTRQRVVLLTLLLTAFIFGIGLSR